jgi:co-chaperonin GroES (HSP10)
MWYVPTAIVFAPKHEDGLGTTAEKEKEIMASKIEPLLDYLLVADKERSTEIGGIALPDNIKQQEMCFGYVIAKGPCAMIQEETVVCYGPYAGKLIVLEGTEFRLIKEAQIEAKIVQVPEKVRVDG